MKFKVLIIILPFILIYGFRNNDKIFSYNNHSIQEKADSLILWNPARKLIWDDFQGNIDLNSTYKAMTYIDVEYKYEISDTIILAFIECYFSKNLSWSKSKKKDSPLLKHEQLHFDIAELITRKIRKSISSHVSSDIEGTQKFINKINTKFYDKELDSLNFAYDTETNHSIIEKQQGEWEKKIAK